jgi:GxxExxY protein
MNADTPPQRGLMELDEITEKVIGCAYKVLNGLGSGFLERVYENALAIEIQNAGLKVKQQYPIVIRYEKVIVGEYIADLLIEDLVLVELKAVEELAQIHSAQCLNYLKATGLKVCLLTNFGKNKIKVKRLVNHF